MQRLKPNAEFFNSSRLELVLYSAHINATFKPLSSTTAMFQRLSPVSLSVLTLAPDLASSAFAKNTAVLQPILLALLIFTAYSRDSHQCGV